MAAKSDLSTTTAVTIQDIDEDNANQSGKRCPWWRVLGISILSLFAICITIAIVLVISGVIPLNGTSKDSPPIITTEPTTPSSNKPVKCKTTKEPPSYRHLGDEPLPLYASNNLHTALFSGKETHSKMLSICKRFGSKQRNLQAWLDEQTTIGSEAGFDRIIRAYEDCIFESNTKLMWTGCFYEHNQTKTNCETTLPLNDANNFCDKVGWEKELNNLQTDVTNPEKDRIYIIKDYRKSDACWQLYLPKQLMNITGQTLGTIPRLPFACIYDDNDVVDE